MNTLKKDWKPDLGLKHILLTIKCLLIVPNPESALNEEAGKLLLEQYDVSRIHSVSRNLTPLNCRPTVPERGFTPRSTPGGRRVRRRWCGGGLVRTPSSPPAPPPGRSRTRRENFQRTQNEP